MVRFRSHEHLDRHAGQEIEPGATRCNVDRSTATRAR